LLDLLLEKNWLKSWIKGFTNVFKKHPFTELDCHFEISKKVGFRLFEHIKTCFDIFTKILDKLVSLGLRINHEWPSSGFEHDKTIFNGQFIRWKTSYTPLTDGDSITQYLGHGD
tara:strand:+ start:579 stop:920 length:342 start_codon:yes stop_codon:yes gene_type:complete